MKGRWKILANLIEVEERLLEPLDQESAALGGFALVEETKQTHGFVGSFVRRWH